MTAATLRPTRAQRKGLRGWLVPAALIFVSLIPVIFGSLRVAELAGGSPVTPANARFFASPVPVLVHIIAAVVYSIMGAFQFVPRLRRSQRGHANWHRAAGMVLVPAGLLVAGTGLWMAAFYDLPAGDGPALFVLRMVFGTAMAVSIVLAVKALAGHNYRAHGAWMARAYAIGIAAGTQALVSIPWMVLAGQPDEAARAVLMGSGWVINLAVAEYALRRRA
jgi:hypothetical protein